MASAAVDRNGCAGPRRNRRSSSGSANKPADSTTSTAAQTGAISNSAQQTVETWFSEVDAKNRTAPNLLEQPYRQDWIRTPDTSWPHFSDISCHAVSESGSAATVHCGFVESRFAGEVKPTTAWNVHLAKQPDGSWLIVRYGAT